MNIRKLKFSLLCLFGMVYLLTGCSGSGNEINDLNNDEQKLESSMFGNLNPKNHIKDIRQYLLDGNEITLSKDEVMLIQNSKPRILKDNNKIEYCFFWVIPNGSIIEVITTAPPECDPILANRSDRIYFP